LLAASLPGHASAHKLQARGGGIWSRVVATRLRHFFRLQGHAAAGIRKMMAEYAMNQSNNADAHVTVTILISTKIIVLRFFLFIMEYPSDFSLDILCCTEGLSVIPVGQYRTRNIP
jgi:hypothetical protein